MRLKRRTSEASSQSVFSLSHAFSLSSALPLWEILFFSAFGISAYVWPSYSNAESQPVKGQRELHIICSEQPLTEDSWSSRWYNLSLRRRSAMSHCIEMEVESVYISAALEEDRFMAWAFRIGKSGYGLGRFVFKPRKHPMHTIRAKGLEEPFATYMRQ
jgi:hypothetical protein